MDIDIVNQLCILAHLSRIDHHIAEEEVELIHLIGRQHGVDKSTIDDIIFNQRPYEVSEKMPYNQKFEILYNCVRLLLADGIINQLEIDFCARIALELGFSKEAIQFITDRFKSSKEELRSHVFQLAYAS